MLSGANLKSFDTPPEEENDRNQNNLKQFGLLSNINIGFLYGLSPFTFKRCFFKTPLVRRFVN